MDSGYVMELWIEGEKVEEFKGMKLSPFLKRMSRKKGCQVIIRKTNKED